LPVDELILVVASDTLQQARIRQYAETESPLPVTVVAQGETKEPVGPAYAAYCARSLIQEDVLVILCDTLFDTDLTCLEGDVGDGLVWIKEVVDPCNYGIVATQGRRIVRFLQNPEVPPSKYAMIGMYYLKDGPALMQRIQRVIDAGGTVRGEFYLPAPLQLLVDDGYCINAEMVRAWYDCGTIESLLDTNRRLLQTTSQGEITRAIAHSGETRLARQGVRE